MAHYRKFVDTAFFGKWSPSMAYVLGYFAADGSMYVNPHGARYVDFVSTDRDLLEQVRCLLQSQHTIALRRRNARKAHWKPAYRLQIGGGELFQALARRGFTPNKDGSMAFPSVPKQYLADFVRGYFDGDSCISFGWCQKQDRRSPSLWVQLCFASGSFGFLAALDKALQESVGVAPGYLRHRPSIGEFLYYQRRPDIRRLYSFFYSDVDHEPPQCYLGRKRTHFEKALQCMGA